jgi:hypothetical protein
MLKAILQTWHDDGVIIFGERELPVTYAIEVRGNSNVIEAKGTVTGLTPGDSYRLLTEQNGLQLRLATGQQVDIAFFGGPIGGPQKIMVNSRMPGLD